MAHEIENPPSLFWMRELRERAAFLSHAKKRFRSGSIDEYELSMIYRAYEYAYKKYTDPMGRKR